MIVRSLSGRVPTAPVDTVPLSLSRVHPVQLSRVGQHHLDRSIVRGGDHVAGRVEELEPHVAVVGRRLHPRRPPDPGGRHRTVVAVEHDVPLDPRQLDAAVVGRRLDVTRDVGHADPPVVCLGGNRQFGRHLDRVTHVAPLRQEHGAGALDHQTLALAPYVVASGTPAVADPSGHGDRVGVLDTDDADRARGVVDVDAPQAVGIELGHLGALLVRQGARHLGRPEQQHGHGDEAAGDEPGQADTPRGGGGIGHHMVLRSRATATRRARAGGRGRWAAGPA